VVTAPENDNGLNISKPVALWNREIKAEPRKLLLGSSEKTFAGRLFHADEDVTMPW
jgi:hypothetical protein